jgi:predicted permease
MLRLAIAAMPVSVPRLDQAAVDWRLLAFALAVVAGTAILFGLMPAVVISRTHAAEALKDGARAATTTRGLRWNRALVVTEVALASAVLVASALLVRSVSRMIHAPIGVVSNGVVTTDLQLTAAGYQTWPEVEQFYTTLLDSIRRQPGVEFASATNALPLDPGWRMPYAVDGRPPARQDEAPTAQHVSAASGYFETLRVPLLSGRLFTDADTSQSEPVVVINQTLATREFPGENPIGRRIVSTAIAIGPLGRNLAGRVPFRIVGVVADVHQAPLAQPPEPVIYHTQRQFPFRPMSLVARGPDTATVTTALRRAVRTLDGSLPLGEMMTMDARVLDAAAAPRLLMSVLTAFAAITAVLAAVGVYGLLACVVNERRRELAIRLALGAQPGALARLVTLQGLSLALAGLIVGLAGAQFARGWLEDVLFRTRTTDGVAMTTTAGILLGATLLACLAPALRAARVAPVEGLKGD